MNGKRITMQLKHRYTTEEREARGMQLAIMNQQYEAVDDERRTVTSEYSKQLKDLRGGMRKLSAEINAGEEEKMVDCLVTMHHPMPGQKTTIRLDTREEVAIDTMTDADLKDNKLAEVDELERLWQEEMKKKDEVLPTREVKEEEKPETE